jgi:hypothetical protein
LAVLDAPLAKEALVAFSAPSTRSIPRNLCVAAAPIVCLRPCSPPPPPRSGFVPGGPGGLLPPGFH